MLNYLWKCIKSLSHDWSVDGRLIVFVQNSTKVNYYYISIVMCITEVCSKNPSCSRFTVFMKINLTCFLIRNKCKKWGLDVLLLYKMTRAISVCACMRISDHENIVCHITRSMWRWWAVHLAWDKTHSCTAMTYINSIGQNTNNHHKQTSLDMIAYRNKYVTHVIIVALIDRSKHYKSSCSAKQ